jgi:serine/threonine-protein kinase
MSGERREDSGGVTVASSGARPAAAPVSPVSSVSSDSSVASLAPFSSVSLSARAETDTDPAFAPTFASAPGLEAHRPVPYADTGSLRGDEPRYLERGILGAGGMGEVRVLHDRHLGRDIARKALHANLSSEPDARRRFVREARVQGQIEHPAVVPVYDLFVDETGALSFTMKRVVGRTLREILAAIAAGDAATIARFSRRKLVTGFATVCLAVDYAHQHGVVHRDLKPDNVMFGDFGEVYVLDWGVAKVRDGGSAHAERDARDARDSLAGSSGPIDSTGIVGTPMYMAPEQVTGGSGGEGGSGGVDARTDVYALGLVLYEILCGRPLRATRSPLAVLMDSANEDPHPLRVAPDVPPELDAICARAAAAKPRDRHPSARALADAIEGYLDGDRDLERRRELAAEHAARAAELHATAADDRVERVMAEVVRALALDAENAAARRLLRALLVESPDRLPAAAEQELDELRHKQRTRAMRYTLYGWLAMTIPMPFTPLLGHVRWRPTLLAYAFLLAMSALSFWFSRMKRIGKWPLVGYFAAASFAMMLMSMWLGPFIMLPVGASVFAMLAGLSCAREERPWVIAFATLAATLPVALELLGVIPRSTFFEPGRVVLLSRFADVEPTWTMTGLVWSSAAFAPLAGVVAGRIRDALGDAERRLFAHSWHLRRIAPDDAGAAGEAREAPAAAPAD